MENQPTRANLRVNQTELVTLRLEWEVLELTAVAVETHQLALLAEYRSKLVHDTAVDTDVLVLCSLTCQNEIPLRNLVVAKEVVQSESEAALQSS